MSDVYILGVDMIKFGRFPDRSVPNIGAEAALMALDDAGLGIEDMQALYCGNLGQSSGMVGQRILQEIGQTGIPVVNCANACATGATAFREAWTSIKAGLYDVVLAVGVEQMGKGLLGGTGAGKGIPKEGLLGSGTKGKRMALENSRIMIHQPLGGVSGQATDIEIHTKEILFLKDKLNKILSNSTGKTVKAIENDTNRDKFMSAEQALEYGLIDKIIKSKK